MFRTLSATFVLWVCLRGTALADVLYTVEELLPLPGHTVAHAYSLNDSGQVVGYSYDPEVPIISPGGLLALVPMLWQEGSALRLLEGGPLGIAMDINNPGLIVGQGRITFPASRPDDITGLIGNLGNGGAGELMWPPPEYQPTGGTGARCFFDQWFSAITDSGHMVLTGGFTTTGLVSPNLDDPLCGLNILELYESGLALTTEGYVFDPIVDGVHQWVVVPTCTGGVTGNILIPGDGFLQPVVSPIEVSDQVASDICGLAGGPLHNKLMNESGQLIMNVGDRAFLLTPCEPFPGGGSTEGCFPGNGPFPGLPEPGTLALVGIGLAGLSFRRRKRIAQ